MDGKGTPFAGGGLSAELRDLGRIGLLMLNGGAINGRRLFLKSVWIFSCLLTLPFWSMIYPSAAGRSVYFYGVQADIVVMLMLLCVFNVNVCNG